MLSVIAFGYALAGYGGSLFGYSYRIDYIVIGLGCGIFCGGLALILWYKNRKKFFYYDDENNNDNNENL